LLVVKINRIMWRKSSTSGGEGCVEVAAAKGSILVRDSKDPHGPMLTFSGPEWTRFLAACTRTKLDGGELMLSRQVDDSTSET
jgi:hypothetical protein